MNSKEIKRRNNENQTYANLSIAFSDFILFRSEEKDR
jgi:hypothetical protein